MTEVTRLPAHLVRVAERLESDVKQLKASVNALMVSVAKLAPNDGELRNDVSGVTLAMCLVSTGLHELTGIVDVAQDLELHPRHDAQHELMLHTLHRAGDHTLDEEGSN